MPKTLKLLLTENVDSLGIVGDVVTVRLGYARNFLLPREMATTPTDEAVQAVAAKRADAQRQLAELRKAREALVKRMEGVHLTITRSCNDMGHLYGSVTQQEIATALGAAGYAGVKPRDVRLNTNIKRVDTYDVHVKFESDLDATIKLTVQPDRKLDLTRAQEEQAAMEAEAAAAKAGTEALGIEPEAGGSEAEVAAAPAAAPAEKKAKAPKEKKPKGAGGEKAADAAPAESKKGGGGWGTPVTRPEGLDFLGQTKKRRRD